MSARKVRLVADLVRGKEVEKALVAIKFANKLAAKPLAKLIKSAISSAEHNYNLEKNNLFVKTITVNEAPDLKRWMPKAHGRATPFLKKGSHINLVIAEIKDSGAVKAREQKVEAPVKLGAKPAVNDGVKVAKKEKGVPVDTTEEKGKVDPVAKIETGRRGHGKIEGGTKGFVGKLFQRKSG